MTDGRAPNFFPSCPGGYSYPYADPYGVPYPIPGPFPDQQRAGFSSVPSPFPDQRAGFPPVPCPFPPSVPSPFPNQQTPAGFPPYPSFDAQQPVNNQPNYPAMFAPSVPQVPPPDSQQRSSSNFSQPFPPQSFAFSGSSSHPPASFSSAQPSFSIPSSNVQPQFSTSASQPNDAQRAGFSGPWVEPVPTSFSQDSRSTSFSQVEPQRSASLKSFSSADTQVLRAPSSLSGYTNVQPVRPMPEDQSINPPKARGDGQKWNPRTQQDYKNHENKEWSQVGEGTYGSVYLAEAPNGDKVALKKIRKEKKEGFPITTIREIKILKTLGALNNKNIVKLKDVVSSNDPNEEGSVYMVFEFCDHDLAGLLEAPRDKVALTDAQVKYYMYEILCGLDHCHRNGIIHRDIKGANVLVSNTGDVKLADFGLARNEAPGSYTNRVVTLWYRPPELLMGSTHYDNKVDMWSAGCLFAELLTRGKGLFRGKTELDQLTLICEICGTPNDENWPDWRNHTTPSFPAEFQPPKKRILKEKFGIHSPAAVDLLENLLQLDPSRRLSADAAMQHSYFWKEKPWMLTKEQHPKYTEQFHEYNSTKRKNSRKRKDQEQQKKMVVPAKVTAHDPVQRITARRLDTVQKITEKKKRNSPSNGQKPPQQRAPLQGDIALA